MYLFTKTGLRLLKPLTWVHVCGSADPCDLTNAWFRNEFCHARIYAFCCATVNNRNVVYARAYVFLYTKHRFEPIIIDESSIKLFAAN